MTTDPADNDPSARQSEPGVWPPSPTNELAEVTPFVSTSGTNGPLPPEIALLKWNWGAFGTVGLDFDAER
jgi:hypothetical protein